MSRYWQNYTIVLGSDPTKYFENIQQQKSNLIGWYFRYRFSTAESASALG